MRKEDEAFADIVGQEFGESWTPPAPEPAPAPAPLPDFHLDLYDDDESYREVAGRRLSRPVIGGLGLIGAGLVIAIARLTPLPLPGWIGWVAVACFVAGTSLSLWHVVRRQPPEDDDEPQV